MSQVVEEYLKEVYPALLTIVSGVSLGQSDVPNYFTDPEIVGLVKNYISILATVGGFIILIYKTFFAKPKKHDKSESGGFTEFPKESQSESNHSPK